jgi:RNA methyltransferase, TrmH family
MKMLTLARDLKRRKARERHGLFVAEGVRTVEELLASPLNVRGVLVSDQVERTARGVALLADVQARGLELLRVSDSEFESAADTEQSQGVLAIAEQPERPLSAIALKDGDRLLVLDGIQDPGNVGTLLRTASAFGALASLVLPGTVDPWNAKVVRAAVGLQFTHPPVLCNTAELLPFLREQGCGLVGAAADGEDLRRYAAPPRLALAVGNEGQGLSDELRAACDAFVAIPMADGAESLNVAVAAGILMHVLRPSAP